MNQVQFIILLLAAVIGCTAISQATNTLVVQSRSVPVCATDVSIDIYITNDQVWDGIIVPLVVRTIEGSAFVTNHLSLGSNGRLAQFELAGGYVFSSAYAVTGVYSEPRFDCPSDSTGHVWAPMFQDADFISPDAVLRASIRVADSAVFYPGADLTGEPSLQLHFDVRCDPGVIEIDTVCIPPYVHIIYCVVGEYGDPTVVVPEFTKGYVTVGCMCECHTDPLCDGIYNIVDWIKIRDVVRGAIQPTPDPNPMCPAKTTDVNCDGQTTIADQNLMFAVVFQGLNPDSVFCEPCQ